MEPIHVAGPEKFGGVIGKKGRTSSGIQKRTRALKRGQALLSGAGRRKSIVTGVKDRQSLLTMENNGGL